MSSLPEATINEISGGLFTAVNVGSMLIGSMEKGDPLRQVLLPVAATGAAFNSQERSPPPICYPGTRSAILGEIEDWIASSATNSSGSVMWLHGPAGAGKSAIAQTICESNAGRLAASFFFSRGHDLQGSVGHFFATIALQLAISSRDLREKITQVVCDNLLIAHQTLSIQVEHLIVRPIQMSRTTTEPRPPFFIVIDGLDECSGIENQSQLLIHLIDLVGVYHLPLYILVTSRPEPHIRYRFDNANMQNLWVRSLHNAPQTDIDIYRFLQAGFTRIHDSKSHSGIMNSVRKPWPTEHHIRTLVNRSGENFFFASTVLRFVEDERFSPLRRLGEVLNASSSSHTTAFTELDKLYAQILSTSPDPDLMKNILGCVLIPVNASSTRGALALMTELLLKLDPGTVELTLRGMHSLFAFKESKESEFAFPETHITSSHASLAEFVFSEERAGVFFISTQEHHKFITLASWESLANWPFIETTNSDRGLINDVLASFRDYVFVNFRFHFSRLRDKQQILNKLKIASTATWATVVDASMDWSVSGKHALVDIVQYAVQELKNFAPQPENLIEQLTSLTDFIFTTHLKPLAHYPTDFQFIQGIFTMYYVESNGLRIRTTQEVADFLQLSPYIQPYWKVIYDYLTTWEPGGLEFPGQLCTQLAFIDFIMSDTRSGHLSIDQAVWNEHLALCYMEDLVEGGPYSTAFCGDAEECLSLHLSLASPREEKILRYIRDLAVDITFSDTPQRGLAILTSAVVTWLEKLREPPPDVQELQSTFTRKISQSVSPTSDVSLHLEDGTEGEEQNDGDDGRSLTAIGSYHPTVP